jgi:hypothetical protein
MAKASRPCRGRFCRVPPRRLPTFGIVQDAPAGYEKNPEAIELARFAVSEHNTKAVRNPSRIFARSQEFYIRSTEYLCLPD